MRKGYKQTEVGVIPEEWGVKPLGEIVDFLDGRRRPVKDSDRAKMRGEIPYYGASGIVDYVNDFLFDDDLILLGEDGENILSRNCRLAIRVRGKIWVNNHAHVLRPKGDFDIGFLTEFLESLDYSQHNSGTAQPKLNKATCANKVIVACPPLPEQRAIAAALGDVDALITGLEQLIAKKRDIKQATMQQLLTGKQRLPGFRGEWEVRSLGDVAQFKNGYPFKSSTYTSLGKFKILTIANVQDGFMDLAACNTIVSIPDDVQDHQRLQWADILISMTGNVGRVCRVIADDCLLNQRVGKLVPSHVDGQFLFFLLRQRHFLVAMTSSAKGGAQGNLSVSDIVNFLFAIPCDPTEQRAIAAVLSDMDAEIDALEKRLEKTRALKQGMMQELLTGRIRLV